MSELPFPHHTYENDPSEGWHEFIDAESAVAEPVPLAASVEGMAQRMQAARVREILLVHGTFAGNDVLGLFRELSRFSPELADGMRRFGKQLLDQFFGESGNYTVDFATQLEALLNTGGGDVSVRPFYWSGENHHIGRAGGAIALLDTLLQRTWDRDDRVLIFAHSHGGNLLAMLSHLVAASPRALRRFFRATRYHYRDPVSQRVDLPSWVRVRRQLLKGALDQLPKLDVVTFGTPIRNRWNTNVCHQPLHFVQHRPQIPAEPARARLPSSFDDILHANGGDYIQQLGIAGTDFMMTRLAWRSWLAEYKLHRMFARDVRRRDLPKNLRQGIRASLDGKTLLVDYAATAEHGNEKLAGHGVYTRLEWVPFHLRHVTRHFYELTG